MQGFLLVPRSIVTDQKIAGTFPLDVLIGKIEKNLKDPAVGMGKFQGIELSLTGANHTGDMRANMFSSKGQADLVSLVSPSASWPGISLDPCFIEILDVDVRVDQIGLQTFQKCLALSLILSFWP